jgi:hypothetical protein
VLMCWNTKVVSLLRVYITLTGNKVDYFLQHFRFPLRHLKRIILYILSVVCRRPCQSVSAIDKIVLVAMRVLCEDTDVSEEHGTNMFKVFNFSMVPPS